MDMSIKRSTNKKAKGMRGRLKTWKLRSAAGREEFECEMGKSWFRAKVFRKDGTLWNTV